MRIVNFCRNLKEKSSDFRPYDLIASAYGLKGLFFHLLYF